MRPTTILSVCVLFFSCSTPSQLLEKGKVEKASKLAYKKLKAGKDVETNSEVFVSTCDQIIQNEINNNSSLTSSLHVEDWVRAQNNYFKLLEKIVVANDLVDGKLQTSYDQLCTNKIELDFKIADHFYRQGTELLATHYESTSKHHAREAYYHFQDCLNFGGDRFFQDIEDKKMESIKEGTVYFVSQNFWPSTNLFFQPLPTNENLEPDCSIYVSYGHTNHDTHISEDVQNYSKEIKVGQKAEKDTSGNTIYVPIYETISANVVTRITEVTLSSYTSIFANNITGQCSKSNSTFNNCVSDTYEEVSVYGDKRAVDKHISICIGEPAFFRSNLESSLESDIKHRMTNW